VADVKKPKEEGEFTSGEVRQPEEEGKAKVLDERQRLKCVPRPGRRTNQKGGGNKGKRYKTGSHIRVGVKKTFLLQKKNFSSRRGAKPFGGGPKKECAQLA